MQRPITSAGAHYVLTLPIRCIGPTILMRTFVQWFLLRELTYDTATSSESRKVAFAELEPPAASRGAADAHAGEMTLVG
jgi:hypothetical protein